MKHLRVYAQAASVARQAMFAAYDVASDSLRMYRRRSYRPILPSDGASLPQSVLHEARCCFVLSTGRCGTELMTKLLSMNVECDVNHNPTPELVYGSKRAYLATETHMECLREIIIHARYENIRNSYLSGGYFVETNNRITFYANALAQAFNRSRFIHLVRHPGDFVRSALRRGYYTGTIGDEGRIVPRDTDVGVHRWADMDTLRKSAWLWNQTQQFIENFKQSIAPDRVLTIRSEDLFSNPETTIQIFEFLGIAPPSRRAISRRIARPINVQTDSENIAHWSEWSPALKQSLMEEAKLAPVYGYSMDLSVGSGL